jgi:hypothetical protein
VASWAEQYRHIWDDRFNRMDTYVQQLRKPQPRRARQR